jgi:hypothetical protein
MIVPGGTRSGRREIRNPLEIHDSAAAQFVDWSFTPEDR